MLLCAAAQVIVLPDLAVGLKPPSNQPQVIPFALSKSPTFGLLIATVGAFEQPS
jgi:hypothetical protein